MSQGRSLTTSRAGSRARGPAHELGARECWAQSFADAATLSPGPVHDLLTALLPHLDRQARGIGALLTVLLDESVRHSSPTTDPALRTWLGTFTGSSAAAKAARSLLALNT